uniref:RING-type domain-containing protein n=1 Tax=Setaria digitata TaxID=48799 RepID=A0A915PJ69_9BILA
MAEKESQKKNDKGKTNNSTGLRCCKCKQGNVWRIKLRQCEHFACITCVLIHLKHWIEEESKARIKCPKGSCPKRIHENDIDAVLDPDNEDLEVFMSRSKREHLLHEHRKQSIYYAFGGLIQRCPLCTLRGVCWMQLRAMHQYKMQATVLLGRGCKLGWDDLFKICFLFKFLAFTEGFLLFISLPLVGTTLIYFGPLLVLIMLPYQVTLLIRECLRRMDSSPLAVTVMTVSLYPILLLASVPFAVGSLLFLIPMSVAYCTIAIIKCIPSCSRACDVLYIISMLAGCIGLNQWRVILRENYEANRQRELAIAREEAEMSERMTA